MSWTVLHFQYQGGCCSTTTAFPFPSFPEQPGSAAHKQCPKALLLRPLTGFGGSRLLQQRSKHHRQQDISDGGAALFKIRSHIYKQTMIPGAVQLITASTTPMKPLRPVVGDGAFAESGHKRMFLAGLVAVSKGRSNCKPQFLEFRTVRSAVVGGSVQDKAEDRVEQETGLSHGDELANVLEILNRVDKFRYHKIPKLKALKLKLRPALVLQVLEHGEVRPSNKWKFFVWAKKQMRFRHTEETYNSIITTLLAIRKFTSVHYLLEAMYDEGVMLTPKTCVRMAKTFGSVGMLERAFHALSHMARLGSPATTRHGNAVISALVKGQHHYKAYVAYREMMAKMGCQPDGYTFKLLFRELARVGKVELACKVFDEMRARRCEEPDAETASILVGVLCQVGRVEDAVCLFESLRQRGLKPNVKVYNSILSGLLKMGEMDKALSILQEIYSNGRYPDRHSALELTELLMSRGMVETLTLSGAG